MNNPLVPSGKRVLWVLSAGATMLATAAILYYNVKMSPHDIVSLFTLIAVGILIYFVFTGGDSLGRIEETLKSIDHKLGNNPGNPEKYERIPIESPQQERPTGGGAFAGMLVGGAIGSSGGPPGVIIGGVVGALIGNFLEYLNIQTRKPPNQ